MAMASRKKMLARWVGERIQNNEVIGDRGMASIKEQAKGFSEWIVANYPRVDRGWVAAVQSRLELTVCGLSDSFDAGYAGQLIVDSMGEMARRISYARQSTEGMWRAVKLAKEKDLEWWANKRSREFIKMAIDEAAGEKLGRQDFAKVLYDAGVKWCLRPYQVGFIYHIERGVRRKSQSRAIALSEKQWARLRGAVEAVKDDIKGAGIDVAVAVVNTRCRCNANLLNGLSRELRVW